MNGKENQSSTKSTELKEFNNQLNVSTKNSYLDMNTRINEPLIPGRIIAEIASAPDKNTNQDSSELSEGAVKEMYEAKNSPTKKNTSRLNFLFLILF